MISKFWIRIVCSWKLLYKCLGGASQQWQNKPMKSICPLSKSNLLGLKHHKFYVRPAEWRNVKYVMEKYEKWVGQKYRIQCLKFPSIIRWWTCVRLAISWAQRDYHTVVSDHHTICPKLNQQTNEWILKLKLYQVSLRYILKCHLQRLGTVYYIYCGLRLSHYLC